MANIFRSAAAEWLRANHLAHHANRNHVICCNSQSPSQSQFRIKRRQMLLASTSVRLPEPGLMLTPNDQVSSLTDYHKLQDAQKLKFKYASDIDVASLFRSSDPTCNGSPAQFSGMVSVPSQHYCMGNNDFVQVKVARPEFSEECRDRVEEVIIEGIKVKRDIPLCFDVYIRPAGREEGDEYAGSFIHLPPRQKQPRSIRQKQRNKMSSCSLRLGITDILNDFDFDVHQHKTVIVTLVPKFNSDEHPINVENICIQYSQLL